MIRQGHGNGTEPAVRDLGPDSCIVSEGGRGSRKAIVRQFVLPRARGVIQQCVLCRAQDVLRAHVPSNFAPLFAASRAAHGRQLIDDVHPGRVPSRSAIEAERHDFAHCAFEVLTSLSANLTLGRTPS